MFPYSQEFGDQDGGSLEERMRSMILNNANTNPVPTGVPPQVMAPVPPHMLTATPEEQQEYLAKAMPQRSSQDPSAQSTQTGRKRLNQAQRRQLNSQLSIPVDTRQSQTAQDGRGFAPVNGPNQSPWTNPHYSGQSPAQQNHRYQYQQPFPPRFQNPGPSSPYSPQVPFPQNPPQSPVHHQPNAKCQFQSRQGQNHFHQQHAPYEQRPPPQNRQLYQPGPYSGQGRGRPLGHNPEEIASQSAYLEKLVQEWVPAVGISAQEEGEKEAFRALVEKACRESIAQYEDEDLENEKFDASTVELRCFGSMSSGFATRASDMDLALLTPKSKPAPDSSESPIPRLLEKKLLGLGYGARLLTRTRVPIIKLCEKPTDKLMSDLLEERTKWEHGFISEPEDEEEISNDNEATFDLESSKDKGGKDQTSVTKGLTSLRANVDSNEEKLLQLKQKEQQSLGDYYNVAKRLLRKLGGRDVSASSPGLDEEESRLLNNVCKAFINGLSSEALMSRLRRYQSISPLFDPSMPFIQRSLHGVWTQMEGERLAMAWDSRPVTEATNRYDTVCFGLVEDWRALQDNPGSLTGPLPYNRQLYIASEKLKKIGSLQLVFLEQIQHEEPIYYQARAQRLMNDLQGFGRDDQASIEIIAPIIISHYIAGVYCPQIKERLRESTHIQTNLQQVALRHRILQLAVDYEHALTCQLYGEDDRPYIEQYIRLLRAKNLDQVTATQTTSPNDDEVGLVKKVLSFPDPTVLSPNKPRDRYKDHLEFPKTNIGIQCDINFSADLALHNTQLLRCYSHCDPRVKVLILFVKHWAKVRGINTPYRGSLSSYGYVLMVLHYLVNIAQPPVCPNLQLMKKDPPSYLPHAEIEARTICNGRDIRFWRNEVEIKDLAERKLMCHNHDAVGMLLRGFFEYFAQNSPMTTVQNRGFDWGREVLSLRTQGGILTKQEKGWVGAKTVVETTTVAAPPPPFTPAPKSATLKDIAEGEDIATPEAEGADIKSTKQQTKTVEETKEIRHRYLFAIEDPFELDHNVARTVTHNGIVSIRDEFRRAWRLIRGVGKGNQTEELLDPVASGNETKGGLQQLLSLIYGPTINGV
jgi:terminal uridylyltransferase